MSKITLNIFEPRYLKMIDRAVKEDISLAIAPSYDSPKEEDVVMIDHESTPYVYKFCGHGKVQVLGNTPQGTKLIMVEGAGKARITGVSNNGLFNEVELDQVEQADELSERSQFIYRRLKMLTQEKLKAHLNGDSEVEIMMAHLSEPQSLVAFYCDHILQDFEKRLEVFNTDSLEEKISLLGQFRIQH